MANPNAFLESPLQTVADEISSSTYSLPEIPKAAPAAQNSPEVSGAPKQATVPGDLKRIFEATAQEFDVPVNILMGLAEQESGYNPKAIGQPTKYGRAKGVMQYLDTTAKEMGINPFAPEEAIPAAAKQLRERLDKGYSMEDAVKEHFAGTDRKQWGEKTHQYGKEVLGRAARIGEQYASVAESDPASLQKQLDAEEPGRYRVLDESEIAALNASAPEAQNPPPAQSKQKPVSAPGSVMDGFVPKKMPLAEVMGGAPVTQEAFDKVKTAYDSADQAKRNTLLSRQDWVGTVANKIDEQYKKLDAQAAKSPALLGMADRREDRVNRKVAQGADRQTAESMVSGQFAAGKELPAQPLETPKDDGDYFVRRLSGAVTQSKALAEATVGLFGDALERNTSIGGSVKEWGYKKYREDMAEVDSASKANDSFVHISGEVKKGNFAPIVDYLAGGAGYLTGQALESLAFALGGAAAGALLGSEAPVAGSIAGAAGGAVVGLTQKAALKKLIGNAVEARLASYTEKAMAKGMAETEAKQYAKQQLGAQVVGTLAGNQTFNLSQELGTTYGGARDEKKGGELTGGELAKATAGGVGAASIETVGDVFGLSRFIKGAPSVSAGVLQYVKAVAKEGGINLSAETSQELTQTIIERWGSGQSLTDEKAVHDYIESAVLGGLGGAARGVAAGALQNKMDNTPGAQIGRELDAQVGGATFDQGAIQREAIRRMSPDNAQYEVRPAAPERGVQQQPAPRVTTVYPESSNATTPLTKAVENAAIKPKKVDVQTPVGSISGSLLATEEDSDGGFTAQIKGDDGQTYTFSQKDGVVITPQSSPITAAIQSETAQAAQQEVAAVQAQEYDLSKRSDKQVEYLAQNGQPGWKEAAISEAERRNLGAKADLPSVETESAPVASTEHVQPKPIEQMSEEELRARVKYLAGQAKMNGGWNKMLSEERSKAERLINKIVRSKGGDNAVNADGSPVRPDNGSVTPGAEKSGGDQQRGNAAVQGGDSVTVASADAEDLRDSGAGAAGAGVAADTKPALTKNGFIPGAGGYRIRISQHEKGSNVLDPTSDVGAFIYEVKKGEDDKYPLTMVLNKDGRLVDTHQVLSGNNSNGTAWVPQSKESADAVRALLERRAETEVGSADRKFIDAQIAKAVKSEGTKPKKASKEGLEHLFGIDKKREKALERINKGTAFFETPEKANDFIAKSGLSDTHTVEQTGKVRFEVKAKKVDRETITPANDKSLGTNDAGEPIYQREDGSTYRIHAGKPDFGGDLVPSNQIGQPDPATVNESLTVEQAGRTENESKTPDVTETNFGNMEAAPVRTYKTQSGKVGATVKRNVDGNGRVSYSYIGAWGAGSGISEIDMQATEKSWRESKRGFTVESDEVAPVSSVAPDAKSASWVIKEKATGKVLMETYDQKEVDALNTEKYEAVPILKHLQDTNGATGKQDLQVQGKEQSPNAPEQRTPTAQERAIAEKSPHVLDLRRKQTGWKAVPISNGDGTILVSVDGKKAVTFASSNPRSGTEATRARMKAQAYAIDNPYSPEDAPTGELVIKPLFNQAPEVEAKSALEENGTTTADLDSGKAWVDRINKEIEKWVAAATNNGTRPIDRNWERSAVKRFIDANVKTMMSGKQYGSRAAAKIAVSKAETFADLQKAIAKFELKDEAPAKAADQSFEEGRRADRIAMELREGGSVVDGFLRSRNGMDVFKLTKKELAAWPDDRKDTSDAIKARHDAVYTNKRNTSAADPVKHKPLTSQEYDALAKEKGEAYASGFNNQRKGFSIEAPSNIRSNADKESYEDGWIDSKKQSTGETNGNDNRTDKQPDGSKEVVGQQASEYPFGQMADGDGLFGTRVKVIPFLEGEEAWLGTIHSVLNGGRLFEVKRDTFIDKDGDKREFPSTIRISGNRIEVVDKRQKSAFAGNKLFTEDKVEAARARLKSKLGRLYSGIDPEILMDGLTITGAYVESGVRDFSAYAKMMIDDFGDRIKPFLVSFWESVRHYPGLNTEGMTPVSEAKKLHSEIEGSAEEKVEVEPTPKDKWNTVEANTRAEFEKALEEGDHAHYDYSGVAGSTVWIERTPQGWVVKQTDDDRPKVTLTTGGVGVAGGYSRDQAIKRAKQIVEYRFGTWSPVSAPTNVASLYGDKIPDERNSAPMDSLDGFKVGDKVNVKGRTVKDATIEALFTRKAPGFDTPDHLARVQPLNGAPAIDVHTHTLEKTNHETSTRLEVSKEEKANDADRNDADNAGKLEEKLPETNPELSEGMAPEAGGSVRQPDAEGNERSRKGGTGRRTGVGRGKKPVLHGSPAEVRPLAFGQVNKTDDRQPQLLGDAPENFEITEETGIGKGTDGQKLAANMAAIRTLRKIQKEGRFATPEEQSTMAKFVGWGGLRAIIDPKTTGKQWLDARAELLGTNGEAPLLVGGGTGAEWKALEDSITAAHYTAPAVVNAMWKAVKWLGFDGGRALEPTSGIGNFIGLQPKELAGSTEWHGAELDLITGQMAKLIYPNASIFAGEGFENVPFAKGVFDLAIGNPPFGALTIKSKLPGYEHLPEMKLHNYIIAKTGEHLRPGGVMSMVVTHRFLDTANPEARDYLAKHFRFLGAFRLPNDAFKENAGTEVTTDVIFLQKLREGEKPAMSADWLDTNGEIEVGGEKIRVNRYYQSNPGNILGRSALDGKLYGGRGGEYTVHSDGRDIGKAIDEVIYGSFAGLAGIAKKTTADADAVPVMMTQSDMPVGGVKLQSDGKIIKREMDDDDGNAVVIEVTPETLWKDGADKWDGVRAALEKLKAGNMLGRAELESIAPRLAYTADGSKRTKPTKAEQAIYTVMDAIDSPAFSWNYDAELAEISKAVNRRRLGADSYASLKGMLDLRNKTLALVQAEKTGAENMEALRSDLNASYDAYVKANGFISDPGNSNLLDGDVGAESGLEINYKQKTKKSKASAAKADILTRRVNFPYKEITSAKDATDGFYISMSERGRFDPAYVAKLAGKSVVQIIEELSTGETPLIFFDPGTQNYIDAEAYLSGNVKAKLARAKEEGLKQNIESLEKSLPAPKVQSQVFPTIRGLWMPESVFEQFLSDLGVSNPRISLARASGLIDVEGGTVSPNEFGGQFKHNDRSIVQIFMSAATGKSMTIMRSDGNGKSHKDETATKEVNLLAERMSKVFQEWVYTNETRAKDIVDAFNERMNTHVDRKFDGNKYLKTVGASPSIKLRTTQKNAAWRMIVSDSVLLDHVVGAGKTYTVITGVMERRRLGLSRKPMVVVPNHLVTQWARDFYKLYPGSKILAATPDDFAKKNRRRLFARIATGDYDAVIVGHSSLGFIETPEEDQKMVIQEQIQMLNDALNEMRANKESGRTLTQIRERIKKYEAKLDALNDRKRDEIGINFADMGIDYLAVDEVHEFKNLEYSTTGDRIVGMNDPNGSQKAFDLYLKTRGIMNRGGAVAGATGTPVSNSLVEIYTMMKYYAHKDLVERGQLSFDAWSGAYSRTITKLEYTATQKLKARRVLGGLNNLSSLRQLYSAFADTITASDLKRMYVEDAKRINEKLPKSKQIREEFPVPKVSGGGRQLDIGPRTEAQNQYMDYLVARMNAIEANKRDREYARIDNPLNVLTDARKMSLDIRIVDPTAPRDENGKVSRSANRIVEIYKKWDAEKGTQLVFCDLSTPAKTAAKDAKKLIKDTLEKVFSKPEATRIKNRIEGETYQKQWDYIHSLIQEVTENEKTDQETRDKIEEYMAGLEDVEATLTTADVGFSVYDDLRALLAEKGIPENEVAFIHDYNSSDQKTKLFSQVDSGEIRVLIGSSAKMGAGMNVQERLVALHHLDAPWRPSDVEQREGRIIRQGNSFYEKDPEGFQVEIYAYSTNGTSDAVMWQVLERKSAAIEEFRLGGLDTTNEDVGDSDRYAEFMAQSTGNPVFRWKLEAERYADELDAKTRGMVMTVQQAKKFVGEYDQIQAGRRASIEDMKKVDPSRFDFKNEGGTAEELKKALDDANEQYLKDYDKYSQNKAEWEKEVDRWDAMPEEKRGKKPSMPSAPSRPSILTKSVRDKSGYARAVHDALVAATNAGESPLRFETAGAEFIIKRGWRDDSFEVSIVAGERKITLASADANAAEHSAKLANAFTPENLKREAAATAESIQRSSDADAAKLPKQKQLAGTAIDQEELKTARDLVRWYQMQVSFAEQKSDIERGKISNKYISRDVRRPLEQFGKVETQARIETVDGVEYKLSGFFSGEYGIKGYQAFTPSGEEVVLVANTGKDGKEEFTGSVIEKPEGAKSEDDESVKASLNPDMFQEGTMTPAQARAELSRGVIGALVSKLVANGDVIIHDAASTLPARAKKASIAQGVTTPDGKIHLILSNMVYKPLAVLFHEAFHSGGKGLVGTAQWEVLMSRLDGIYSHAEQSTGKARVFFDAASRRVKAAKSINAVREEMTAEEFGAYIIEEYENAPASFKKWVDDLIGVIKAWLLSRFGKQIGDVTPAQLRGIALLAMKDKAQYANYTEDTKNGLVYEIPAKQSAIVPINGERLKALRRAAAEIERPKDGVFLRVTEEGYAIATGKKGQRIPVAFRRFAEENGLTFKAERKLPLSTGGIGTNTEAMPITFRESGAMYFGEMSGESLDRTGNNSFSVEADTSRKPLEWAEIGKNENGPTYQGNGFSIEAVRKFNTETDFEEDDGLPWGHAAYVTGDAYRFALIDSNDREIGFMDAEVNGLDEISAIHDIELTDKGRGWGTRIIESILANTYDGVRIIEALPQAMRFWGKFGADYDYRNNAEISWEGGKRTSQQGRSLEESARGGSNLSEGAQYQKEAGQDSIYSVGSNGATKSRQPFLKTDVPNERWLQEQVEYAKSQGKNRFGVPYMGKTTAVFSDDVRVPINILAELKGQRGEQDSVREEDLSSIKKIMEETGKLPLRDNGKEYVPYIEVAYDGSAWVSEGNHRIMAARDLGWSELPVEIRYFDGGERKGGLLKPEAITQNTSYPVDQTKTAAFKKWFGDSKVVDADGNPIIVYHGSPDVRGILTEGFKARKSGVAFFAAADYAVADSYANDLRAWDYQNAEPQTIPLYLKIENPMVVDANGAFWRETERYVNEAKEKGHDGLIIKNSVDFYNNPKGKGRPTTVYAWFNPTQAKSAVKEQLVSRVDRKPIPGATGNAGTFDPNNPDIRYSVAPDRSVIAEEIANTFLPEDSKLDPFRKAQAAIQDSLNRLKQVQGRIAEVTGQEELGKADYYRAETLRPGRIAARLEDAERLMFKPLMEQLAKSGYKQEDLEELLHAQHAEERNAKIAEINEDFPDGGSGMSNEKAREILKKYASAAELKKIAQKARDIARETLAVKQAYGLIDDETYETLTEAYKFYVPLKGDIEPGAKIKRAMGHEERQENILGNIVRDFKQAVVVGEKNLARQSLVQLILEFPDSKLWTASVPPKGRTIKNDVGYKVKYIDGSTLASFDDIRDAEHWIELQADWAKEPVAMYSVENFKGEKVTEFTKPLQDNEIMVYVKGQGIRLQINDAILAGQLRPMDEGQLHWALDTMRSVNRHFARVYTGYNPAFIIRNASRDALTGTINITGNYGASMAARAWKNYPAAVAALAQWATTGEAPSGKMGTMLNQYRSQGGKIGASYMGDLEEQGKKLNRLFDDAYGVSGYLADGKVGKAAWIASRKAVMGTAHVVEVMNQATENALRLALFAAMREAGESPAKAAQAAKTVTVDFDRKGSATGALGALYLFINPAIQGTANAANTLFNGKHKGQAWTMLGSLALLGLYAATAGMDDDKDRWLGAGWDRRTKNFMFNVGGYQLVAPVSQEYAPFYAFGVAVGEVMRGEKPMTSAVRLLSSFIDAYYPINGVFNPDSNNIGLDAVLAHVPTVGQLPAQIAANRNHWGSQVVPENEFTANRPDNLKMSRATKGTVFDVGAQNIAAAGQFLGASKYENDITKVSPETLKLTWSTYFGGLGNFVADTVSLGKLGVTAPGSVTTADWPIAKDFVRPNDIKPIRGRYYDLANEARKAIDEFKQARKAGDWEALSKIGNDPEKMGLVSLEHMISSTNKATAKLRDRILDINADPSLGVAEKREMLKEVEAMEEMIYRSAISAFK